MLQKSYPILQEYSALVASTLLTGLDEWSNIFQFNKKPRVAITCAEADGYLSFDTASIEKFKLPEDLERKLRLVIDKDLSDFLFWEFKSMNAGTMGVMLAIFHLTGSEFPWCRCPMSKHCDNQSCQKKNNRFRFNVTGKKTGADGTVLEGKSGDSDDSSTGPCFSFDLSELDCSIGPVHDTRRWKFGGVRSSKKPESDNPHLTDAGGDVESNTDDDTLPFTEGDYHKALKIVQQIWAEAVNIDATFIVLNCANLEYIGIRDRKLQRLYLSPLLDLRNPKPDRPGYFKIHTGLEIVALLDAIDRAERLNALPQHPELYTYKYDRSEQYEDSADEDEDDALEMNFIPTESNIFHQLRYAHSLKIT
ncbi:hypothetical protein EDD85DRAFT_153603 [Armillaria nabsnona]|nr:hypothetical protein EDD85DRAFT_153603 [Armillaria nabsnona]